MIQQTGQSLIFIGFFTESKIGKTGLTVTIDIYNPAGTLVVTAGSATALGGGAYSYTLSSGSVSTAGNYLAIFKTATTTVDQQHVPSLWTVGEAWVQNVDAAITSRNSVAPDNTSIATILTRTDVATSTRASAADYTTARAAKIDNLDATVSSRNATTPPTVAAIRAEMDSNSTKLDATVSSRSSHTAADVWAVGTRTLTTFGTLVADIATAVWGAASRTLSAFGFSVTASSVTDKTGYSLVTAPLTSSQTGAAVLDATTASHATAGTIGAAIGTAGSAADPLTNAVPGSYASGTAGYYLGRLASASITVSAPVLTSGNISIIRGDSYYSADARALIWTITGLPTIDLTGATTTFAAKQNNSSLTKTNSSSPGVTASFSSGTLTLTVELASADTSTLSQGDYRFDIQTLFSNAHVETWVQGTMTVVPDVR